MTLLYAAPSDKAAKQCILYTKTSAGEGDQGFSADPIEFNTEGMPPEVAEAFRSIIMGALDLKDEDWAAAGLPDNSTRMLPLEDVQKVTMSAIAPWVRYDHQWLKDPENTAYICPIISAGGIGFWRGYVVARNEEDAQTIAEYLANGAGQVEDY